MSKEMTEKMTGYAADVEKSRAEGRKIMEGLGYSEAKTQLCRRVLEELGLLDAQGRTIGAHGKAYRVASQPSLLLVANGVLIERVELDAARASNTRPALHLIRPLAGAGARR